ncbi:hypothetical protein KR51_00034620 [Rubidibacter lacunae KORDI 51-2]|uniref:Uncharacterized protein n=2 Tax=Rubidibacter TaxID=582491 RepID=U5DKE7_9CHRO|nr:hypothetical protein KR51_00034620 [Rubidibacter lacunae KORDI 51-2]
MLLAFGSCPRHAIDYSVLVPQLTSTANISVAMAIDSDRAKTVDLLVPQSFTSFPVSLVPRGLATNIREVWRCTYQKYKIA